MYEELRQIWEQELAKSSLAKLPTDFYSKLAEYMQKLKEERRMLDRRTVKARLLRDEARNVKHMIYEIAQVRYRKFSKMSAKGDKVPNEILAQEEEKIPAGLLPLAETYHAFIKNLLQGRLSELDAKHKQRICALRVLGDIPAIIGADMKTYGPFKPEDLASLPVENSKILIKQGLAEEVDLS